MSTTPSGSPHPSFGELLRRLRVAHGLTQELLAERSGLSVRGISDIERGARSVPHRETIQRLIVGLALPEDEQALLLAVARRAPRPRLVSLDMRWPVSLATRRDAFIGRAAELTAIVRALQDSGSRLLTLTGPPGVGKTRLAVEAMRRLAGLVPDEIVFVDLAPLTSSQLVLPAIAAAVGVQEAGTGVLSDRLQARLASKPAVLVLDNFEHLLAAAPDVADVVRASSAARLLVTSREPLHSRDEQVLAVPPLATPQLTLELAVRDLVGHDAVELFVMRARESDPGFHLTDENARAIAELCVRLDGLPLAIELAAARVPQLAPAAIVERLAERRPVLTAGRRELPPRQRTLADAIDWSYALLDADEQRLLRRLSVFLGGFTVEAAEYVGDCSAEGSAAPGTHWVRASAMRPDGGAAREGGPPPATPFREATSSPSSVFDVTASLVDKNLLLRQPDRAGSDRFTMLETIREYGLERLAASGEGATVRATHAAYFLTFAEDAARDHWVGGARQRAAVERLAEEHDNLRQALAWALGRDDPTTALRLSSALWRFWWSQGHLSEGQRWLERTLERAQEAPPAARARTLIASGRLAWLRGDLALATQRLEEALALGPEPFDRCEALNALGDVARYQVDYDRAEAALTEALDLARTHEDWFHVGTSLHNLGTVALDRGDCDRARAALEAGLGYARRAENWYLLQSTLHFASLVAVAQGDYARAAAMRREDLAVQRELAPVSPHGAARFLEGVALLAVVQDQFAPAARLFGAASRLRDDVEDMEAGERKLVESWIAAAREHLGEEAFACDWTAGRALSLEGAIAEAAHLLEAWSWTEAAPSALP